jgi:hypothetical protein
MDLEKHIDEMGARMDAMHQQLIDSQQQMDAMRAELTELRRQLAAKDQVEADGAAASLRASVQQLQEDSEVLQAEVKQHDQTKVESASKFPVRISGTVLFTSNLISGGTDNIDLPLIAAGSQGSTPQGSLSATARQSMIGIDSTGPHFWGAASSATVSVDFFGGIPYADNTTAAGIVRLRTAQAALTWPSRALTIAFDRPILSPREPTSWISVGEPALAWSGNLWTWAPQLEYRQNVGRGLDAEFALIDPPAPANLASTGLRTANAAESSRQPGYELHLEDAFKLGGHGFEVGAGGYLSRQDYEYGTNLDAWAGTLDWRMVLAAPLEFSGAFYRGRGIGGLGGGTFKDYLPYDNYSYIRDLDDEGGWGQLKWRIASEFEVNAAAGSDNGFASELRASDLDTSQDLYANLARNLTFFGNFVYRPRTYLLLSAEYRQIRSWPISGAANQDRNFGLAAGYSF